MDDDEEGSDDSGETVSEEEDIDEDLQAVRN